MVLSAVVAVVRSASSVAVPAADTTGGATAVPASAPAPVPAAGGADAAGVSPGVVSTCQAVGWDMSRELTTFAHPPRKTAAGSSVSSRPLLRVDTLYALRLRPQSDVRFAQPPARPGRATTPMAGMTRFRVATAGLYRVTVDSPLWMDVVTSHGVTAPTAYTGWHDCSVFRKSVDYTLEAGQAVTLQFSDAATDLVKVTIEPPPAG